MKDCSIGRIGLCSTGLDSGLQVGCRGSTLLLLLDLNRRHPFRAQARQLAQHPREPHQELCDQALADDAADHEGDAQDLLGLGLGLGLGFGFGLGLG